MLNQQNEEDYNGLAARPYKKETVRHFLDRGRAAQIEVDKQIALLDSIDHTIDEIHQAIAERRAGAK